MFAGQHEKSFVPAFFKISTDHLFDKLESGKELHILLFFGHLSLNRNKNKLW